MCNSTATSNGKDIKICYGIQKYLVANVCTFNVPASHNQISLLHLSKHNTSVKNNYQILFLYPLVRINYAIEVPTGIF